MNSHSDLSNKQFEIAFANCSLAPELFNHEAHLRLVWIHLQKSELNNAINAVCHQLITFVGHVGAKDKYHATLTVAAVHIVHHFIEKSQASSFSDFITEFPQLKTDFKGLIQAHYSFDIFRNEAAKKTYLPPDLLAFKQ